MAAGLRLPWVGRVSQRAELPRGEPPPPPEPVPRLLEDDTPRLTEDDVPRILEN